MPWFMYVCWRVHMTVHKVLFYTMCIIYVYHWKHFYWWNPIQQRNLSGFITIPLLTTTVKRDKENNICEELKGKNDSNTYTTMWCSRPQTERSPCMSWNWLKCNKCTRFFVFLFLCSLNKSELEVWPAILLPNTQRWKIAISHSVSSDSTG